MQLASTLHALIYSGRRIHCSTALPHPQGNLEEAEALLRRTAEAAASSLGPLHAYTANALSNLGVALRKVGPERHHVRTTRVQLRPGVVTSLLHSPSPLPAGRLTSVPWRRECTFSLPT